MRILNEDPERSWEGWLPTVLCAVTMLALTAVAVAHPVATAWGEDAHGQVPSSLDVRDKIEGRSPHDVEMLRRLLEMTLRAQGGAAGASAAPIRGAEAAGSRGSAAGT
jgi:hypothetical protein